MLLRNMPVNAIETIEQFTLKSQIIHFGTRDTMPITPQQLLEQLNRLNIPFELHRHPPLHTVEESRQLRGNMDGGHCKNLFLKDKKGALVLVSALGDTRVAINQMHKALGCQRLSFGKEELMWETLGVRPGSVTAFALINDPEARVRFVLDAALLEHELVNFHPLKNDATTTIGRDDFLTFVRATGREPDIIDFSELAPPPT